MQTCRPHPGESDPSDLRWGLGLVYIQQVLSVFHSYCKFGDNWNLYRSQPHGLLERIFFLREILRKGVGDEKNSAELDILSPTDAS